MLYVDIWCTPGTHKTTVSKMQSDGRALPRHTVLRRFFCIYFLVRAMKVSDDQDDAVVTEGMGREPVEYHLLPRKGR